MMSGRQSMESFSSMTRMINAQHGNESRRETELVELWRRRQQMENARTSDA